MKRLIWAQRVGDLSHRDKPLTPLHVARVFLMLFSNAPLLMLPHSCSPCHTISLTLSCEILDKIWKHFKSIKRSQSSALDAPSQGWNQTDVLNKTRRLQEDEASSRLQTPGSHPAPRKTFGPDSRSLQSTSGPDCFQAARLATSLRHKECRPHSRTHT